MKSLLAELADTQFAACQLIAAVAHDAPDTQLPVSSLAQALFLDEDDMRTLYGSHMTARDVVTYATNCPASHLLTYIYSEARKAND
ncbi:hypothetical protein ACFWR9_31735 [Streptomyces sp. NPDC058534]|uniref:hypothetical protein n=1 Tax=Streptomyces sp. NPDC058534 TaxID=3346541 RepID=UPI003663D325